MQNLHGESDQRAAKTSLIVILAHNTMMVVIIATAIKVIVVFISIFIFPIPSATNFVKFISIAKMTGFRHEKGNF